MILSNVDMYFHLKERELRKVSTPNDDDEAGGYKKTDLDCIIGASLVDDWGANIDVLDRIVKFYRAWYSRRSNHSSLGRDENVDTITLARSKAKSKRRMSKLPSNGRTN